MMNSVWLEIPVRDLARAKAFYEAVFEHAPTEVLSEDGRQITVIEGQPTVSLNQTPGFVPTDQGSLPYFHLDGPIADALDRVTRAGGRVVEPATPRADRGLFSLVTDSEGNALYLHAAS
jgi:uncharacterized protein